MTDAEYDACVLDSATCPSPDLTSDSKGKAMTILVQVKVIYHPLYGMNNFVLIWGDWLSCDTNPRYVTLSEGHI